ncbi:hypothetical protein MTR_5g024930 [Medicago truncatula]|uniref:Uncharacterized protein n=1 Tax=Medicago truncatula TaxID=3880 RepID=G7K2M2_MEDTR|nr:hypothetical protein MTR_5g024930 [Medicago truncatula]
MSATKPYIYFGIRELSPATTTPETAATTPVTIIGMFVVVEKVVDDGNEEIVDGDEVEVW